MNPRSSDPRPLVMHVMHAFGIGGLENGVANLVNHLPAHAYRHAIVALTAVTDFRARIRTPDVEFIALDKRPGHGAWVYPRFYRLLREKRPAIVHTRNLAALEMTLPARAAGVPVRIHGEHGRDVGDLDGSSLRHQWLRRAYRPFVDRYVALSQDLARYLVDRVGVPESRVTRICNGVDTSLFSPPSRREVPSGSPFGDERLFVFGSVGRMAAVKDPVLLARAFVELHRLNPGAAHARLLLVGDGPLRTAAMDVLRAAGIESLAWFAGARNDVPAMLRGMDCFVLPSLAEGISNTILEAMATGLPVIATEVGGNCELVVDGVTGSLVPPADAASLAHAMLAVVGNRDGARASGLRGRQRAVEEFSLDVMVGRYLALYDASLRSGRSQSTRAPSLRGTGGGF